MERNKIEDLDEFAICCDIASRTALFALAKICTAKEIDGFYGALQEALKEGGYKAEKIEPIIEQFNKAAILIRQGPDNA